MIADRPMGQRSAECDVLLATQGILASAKALVHPSIVSPDERHRHATFLAHTLALTSAACAVAPFYLAFHGAPTLAESLLFALALVQVGAATLVARTGRLVDGHGLSFVGLVGVGVVLFVGLRAGAGVAVSWLVAAQLEVVASFERRLINAASIVTGATLLAIVAASLDGRLATRLSDASAAGLALLAFVAAASALRRIAAAALRLEGVNAALAARSRALDATLGATVATFDAGGSLRSLSSTAPPLLDAPDHALLGRGLFEHIHVADRPAFLKQVDDAAHGPGAITETLRLRGWTDAVGNVAERRYRSFEVRAHGLPADPGDPSSGGASVLAVLRDVSGQHRPEEATVATRETGEATPQTNDLVLTTMSHELRTPLNAIIGFSEILASRTARPDDVAKQHEFARIINESGRQLLTTVNSVIDLSRLQMGAFPLQTEPVDVTALLEQSCETVAGLARDLGVRIARDYPPNLDEIAGDKRALAQALVALLSNAIKLTPKRGLVTLSAKRDGSALVVAIADSSADAPSPAGEAHTCSERGFDGAGLGPTLARGLIALHGGTLTVASRPEQGILATIRLPQDGSATSATPIESAVETLRSRRPQTCVAHLGKDAA